MYCEVSRTEKDKTKTARISAVKCFLINCLTDENRVLQGNKLLSDETDRLVIEVENNAVDTAEQ